MLLWTAFGGSFVALAMALALRSLNFSEAMEAWVNGAKAMVMAVLILVLAWGMGTMCKDYLQTGSWLLAQVQPSPHMLPVLTFLVSAGTALATGSSFSTMAIVIPIAGPMAWVLTGTGTGLESDVVDSIRYSTLAAVLSGSVLGDHCSPISDTTIMSSMGAGSDHIDHVRTQIPYALVCGAVAAVVGFVPAGYGVSPLAGLIVGCLVLLVVLFAFGRVPRALEEARERTS